MAAASLAAISARFGISFDVAAKWVADFIEARANKLAGQVTQTTYEAIQAALNEGVAVGESIDDLAGRIRTLFAQTYASRAETVARTEVISAYNGAACSARRSCRPTSWPGRSGSPPVTDAPAKSTLPPTGRSSGRHRA